MSLCLRIHRQGVSILLYQSNVNQLAWQPRRSTFVRVSSHHYHSHNQPIADTTGTAGLLHLSQLLRVRKWAKSSCLGYNFGGASL